MDDRQKKILDRLENQCARRECCSSDVLRKATELLEGDEAAAREVLGSLTEGGFVDDSRYAAAFATTAAMRPPSPARNPASPAGDRTRYGSPWRQSAFPRKSLTPHWRRSTGTVPRRSSAGCWRRSGRPSKATRRPSSNCSATPCHGATNTSRYAESWTKSPASVRASGGI